jgi:hypothetical protein
LISVAIRKSVRPWLPLGNAEGVPPIAAQWQGTGGGEAVGRASGQGAKCAAARCDLMMSVPLDGLVTARAFSLLELSVAKLQFNSHRSRNRSRGTCARVAIAECRAPPTARPGARTFGGSGPRLGQRVAAGAQLAAHLSGAASASGGTWDAICVKVPAETNMQFTATAVVCKKCWLQHGAW